jgi:hypothetical protein
VLTHLPWDLTFLKTSMPIILVLVATLDTDSDILAGINWAVNNAQTYNIKAVNLSLGVPGVKYTSE